MGNFNKRHALSLLIAAGGCVAGAYSAFAAFSNGKIITGGAPGIMFGLAFGAVVIISWIMLPWADKRAEDGARRDAWLWRLSWLMALGFVLANSIVYSVHYRTEMTEMKGLQIDAYERAVHIEALAASELNRLQTNPRWEATSGCSNVTATKSRLFCEQVHAVQARMQNAEAALAQGRPAAKDPGAETLAWVLSADEAKIRRSLPIFWAVILELIASLCMREAFATFRKPEDSSVSSEKQISTIEPAAAIRTHPASTAGFVHAPVLGVLAPFTWEKMTQRAAINDNLPLAAYA